MKKHIAIAIALMTSPAFAANLVSGTENDVKGNYNTVTGERLTVVGHGNTVSGTDIVVAGESNAVSGIHNTVDGKINVVSGHNAAVKGNMSVAIGQRAEAYNSMVTAVGSDSKGLGESSVAIGSGAQALERFSTAVGGNAVATNQHDVALGFGSKTAGAVGTATAEVNGVKYGTFAGHRPVGETSMGSEDWKRNVTNVAAGRITKTSTDAVNGSQLFAVANKVGENAKGVEANKKTIAELGDVVAINAGNIEANTQQITTLNHTVQQQNAWNEAQDGQINELRGNVDTNTQRLDNLTALVKGMGANEAILRKEMHDLRRESRAGIAGTNAIAGIPQPHAPGQTAFGVGAGYFKHEGAVAVGMSHISKSGKWVSKAGVNFDTRKNVGAAVGLSYVWGGVPVVVPAPVVIHKTEVVEKVIVREVAPVPAQVKVRQ